jgi:hypothetical protein
LRARLGRVLVVEINLVRLSYDLAIVVVTAGPTNMMGALQLTTVRAFRRVTCDQ